LALDYDPENIKIARIEIGKYLAADPAFAEDG
jgi:hypothetical protein